MPLLWAVLVSGEQSEALRARGEGMLLSGWVRVERQCELCRRNLHLDPTHLKAADFRGQSG